MSKDYNSYDYLAVSVKSDQLDRILQCYHALGWTEVKTEDDREYYNMKYVRLRRPHRIENKDRLQYLQVRMERAINSLVSIVNRAHVRSSALFFFSMLFSVCLAGTAVWLVIEYASSWPAVLGWVCLGLAVAAAAAGGVRLIVLRGREKKSATEKIMDKLRLARDLIEEAHSLSPATEDPSDGFDEAVPSAEAANE